MSINPIAGALLENGVVLPTTVTTQQPVATSQPQVDNSLPTPAKIEQENIDKIVSTGQDQGFTQLTEQEKIRHKNALAAHKAAMKAKNNPDGSLSSIANTSAKAQVAALKVPRETNDDVMVKLTSTITGAQVKMIVSPLLAESRSASYESTKMVHNPGQIQLYITTDSRAFSLEAKFVSRTSQEATQNLIYLNLIRSWVMPYFGKGTGKTDPRRLGAPPDVLKLEAYGTGNIKEVPVVLTSYDTRYDNQVDYIPTADGTPFPVIIDISMKLVESYSPAELSKFSLRDYRQGKLPNVKVGTGN